MENPISRSKVPMPDQADGKDRTVILSPGFIRFCQLDVGQRGDTLEGADSRSLALPAEAKWERIPN